MARGFIFSLSFFCLANFVFAQDDLLGELEESSSSVTAPVIGTFKGNRIISGHSVETTPYGSLVFIFSHRFDRMSLGSYDLWGLDESLVRLGLEYGITDRLNVGIGRSSDAKIFDGFLKYKILEQGKLPLTVTGLTSIAYRTYRDVPRLSSTEQISYAFQLLIARKFSSAFSLQLSPTVLHRNYVPNLSVETNTLFALGLAARVRLTRSMALISEYYYRVNEKSNNPYFDAIGMGLEIETGGHVFQLLFTNTPGMIERSYLPENMDDFFDGDIHFGFNITRTFQLARKN